MEKINWFFDSLVQTVNRTPPNDQLTRLAKNEYLPKTSVKKLEKDFREYLKQNRNWIKTFVIEKTEQDWYKFTLIIGETTKYVDKPVYVPAEIDKTRIISTIVSVVRGFITKEKGYDELQKHLIHSLKDIEKLNN